jgi:hypothetical protein
VLASTTRLGSREVELDLGEAPEAELRFLEPATLHVRLRGATEAGILDGLAVTLRGDTREGRRVPDGEGDPPGRWVFGPLSPGNVGFRLVRRFEGSTYVLVACSATLSSGRNDAEITVPRLHTLTVFVTGEGTRRLVEAKTASEFVRRHAWTDENGRAELRYLPAGEYEVALGGVRRREGVIARVPGPPVRLTPPRLDALRVRVSDPEGFLARAGFRTGDRIVGMDGEEFEGEADLRLVLSRRGEHAFLVDRDGGRITIRVSFDALRGGGLSPGGSLDPVRR